MPSVVPAVPYLRRFRMGRKYLEVLTAKMMLGMRKKVHHPRQNQKAFWTGTMRSAHQAGQTAPSLQPQAHRLCTDPTSLASCPPTVPVHWTLYP